MLTASNAHAALTRSYDAAHRQLSETQTLSGLPGSKRSTEPLSHFCHSSGGYGIYATRLSIV
jgi:hypothetical protein